MTLDNGHELFFQSVGTFSATGTISIAGQYWILPAEKAAELL
jgi:hypothetical protein